MVKSDSNRLFFLDFLKAVSITAVVSYHSLFIPLSSYESSAFLLEVVFSPLRFCVPVLLTISFFLLERGLVKKPQQHLLELLRKRFSRLLIPAFFWFGVAAFLKIAKGNSINELAVELITGKIFTGSYYFLIIFQLIPLFVFTRKFLRRKSFFLWMVTIQVLIYFLIKLSLTGIFFPGLIPILNLIDRPFFVYWIIYMAFGAFFYHKFSDIFSLSLKLKKTTKVIILSLFFVFMTIEYNRLVVITAGNIPPFDYLTYSCILSVPVAFICFSSLNKEYFSSSVKKMTTLLSKYSLGIFCLNGIISQILLSIGTQFFGAYQFSFLEALSFKLLGWFTLLLSSLYLSILLEKIGFKKMVC